MEARFVSREPIAGVVEAVLGEDSIELDRDRYPWQEIHGRLDEVLCGKPDARQCDDPPPDWPFQGFDSRVTALCT